MVPITTFFVFLLSFASLLSTPSWSTNPRSYEDQIRDISSVLSPFEGGRRLPRISLASRVFELSGDRIAEVKMHLWPSLKIRDSFKFGYVQNYERNLRRMNSEKQSAAIKQRLQQKGGGDADQEAAEGEASGSGPPPAIALWGRDLLAVLSCFYCCYAFEDCADEEY